MLRRWPVAVPPRRLRDPYAVPRFRPAEPFHLSPSSGDTGSRKRERGSPASSVSTKDPSIASKALGVSALAYAVDSMKRRQV
jgi:hypothetical protein